MCVGGVKVGVALQTSDPTMYAHVNGGDYQPCQVGGMKVQKVVDGYKLNPYILWMEGGIKDHNGISPLD